MTREEFIKKYKNDCRYYFDGYYSDCIDDFLTNIYNDHEAQLKVKDEEIEKLKKLVNGFNNTYSVGDFDFESYYAMLKEN